MQGRGSIQAAGPQVPQVEPPGASGKSGGGEAGAFSREGQGWMGMDPGTPAGLSSQALLSWPSWEYSQTVWSRSSSTAGMSWDLAPASPSGLRLTKATEEEFDLLALLSPSAAWQAPKRAFCGREGNPSPPPPPQLLFPSPKCFPSLKLWQQE